MADSNTDADTDVRPKRRLGVVLVVASLLVLGLALVGIWKSNNFETIESLDYFVCTGTIDGRTLLAELNFQKNKDVLALIVFPDGRHWSLAGRRFEHGQHSWNLLDPDSKVAGQLIGEWDSKTGKFSGRLIATDSKEKPAVVELQRVAQFEHRVLSTGLRIGSCGVLYVFDFLEPRFDDELDGVSQVAAVSLNRDNDLRWEDVRDLLRMNESLAAQLSLRLQSLLDESFEAQSEKSTHVIAIADKVLSWRQIERITNRAAPPTDFDPTACAKILLGSYVFDAGIHNVQLMGFSDDPNIVLTVVPESMYAFRNQLRRKLLDARDLACSKLGVSTLLTADVDFAAEKRQDILRSLTFCLEPAGIRFQFHTGGLAVPAEEDIAFLMAWDELQSLLNSRGPARHFVETPETSQDAVMPVAK